jgi:hypothetical protein
MPSRRRRFFLLSTLSALGALLFVPFLVAEAPTPPPSLGLVGFVVIATTVAVAATWLGLGWADGAKLPMPILRAIEERRPPRIDLRALSTAVGLGAAFGIAGLVVLRALGLPGGAGSFAVRAASAVFASITLEVVVHLAIMSGTVRLTRRVPLGIAAAALAFILFHLGTLGNQPPVVVAATVAVNGVGGLLFGVLYATFGFEYLVVAHFVAHLVTVGAG